MPVRVGAALAGIGLGFTLVNRLTLRCPAPGRAVPEPVTVLLPARDEASRVGALLGDLRVQRGVPGMRVFVLDDDSSDRTFDVAAAAVADDPRFTVLRGVGGPPPGWVGKQWACARLVEAAGGHPDGVLVFVDADVRLAPDALAAAAGALRASGVGLLSPWPVQVARSRPERAIQPLLAWSWAVSLPVAVANRSLRPSTAVACGQFLVVDAGAYRRVGGHNPVASSVTEDLALARVLRRAGVRTGVLPAGSLASCRMYDGAAEIDAGYARWLWSAYGGAAGSAAVAGMATLAYLVPVVAIATGRQRRWGVAGYAAAVASRLVARSMEGGPVDVAAALAHPLSVAGYLVLLARSHRAHRRGRTAWRGRRL